MRSALYIALCLLLVSEACHKSTAVQPPAPPVVNSNSTVFKGVASYSSYYYSPEDTTLKMNSQLVFIAEDTGSYNPNIYIDSTLTDKSGNFSFYDLDPTIHYLIFSHPSIASSSSFSAPYLGMVDVPTPYDSTTVYSFTAALDGSKTNGIDFTAQDAFGGAIGGATIIIYDSKVIATADSIFSGEGSVRKVVADSLGKALVTGLPATTLYVNALLEIDSVNYFRSIANPVTVSSKGFLQMTLTLR